MPTSPVQIHQVLTNGVYAQFADMIATWTNGTYYQNADYNLTPTVNSPESADASGLVEQNGPHHWLDEAR